MDRVGERQQRADKKRDIKPTIALELKDVIYRISHMTYIPVKDVCQQMTILVLKDRKSMEQLSKYFKRDLRVENTFFMGSITNEGIVKRRKEAGERVTIRYTQKEYESLAALSYALDCTPSRTVALLLEIGMQNIKFINAFIKQHLQKELSNTQMRELREILKYVSEVDDTHHSWASLLALVNEEIGSPVQNIRESITEFIKMKWR